MFCENCGKQNPDGAKFCENCGGAMESVETEVTAEETVETVAAEEVVETPVGAISKKTLLIGAIAAGAVVLVLLLALFGVFKSGPVKVVEKAIKGAMNANANAVYTAMDVPYTRDEDMDKEDRKELIEEMQEELKEEKEDRKDDGIKVSIKSVKKTKSYKKSEVKAVEAYLEDEYGYDVDEYPLQGLACVQAKIVMKEDGDKDTEKEEVITAKVKGKWYVMRNLSKNGIKEILDEADED